MAIPSTPTIPSLSNSKRAYSQLYHSQRTAVQSSRDGDVVRAFEVESEEDIEHRENSDSMNEIVMAVDLRDRCTIGCAYYIAREEKLYLTEDIKMAGLEIIDMLKVHVSPTVILISTRSDESLEDHLMKDARGIDRGDDVSTSHALFPIGTC
jgi:DNA mismatch repair protein MSH5